MFNYQNLFSSSPTSWLKSFKSQEFYTLYKDYLKKELGSYDDKKWDKQDITNPNLIAEAARPDRAFYNNTIFWYRAGHKTIGFRPLDTPTDCNSGCSPVVFHFAFDKDGKALSIIEEPGEPLRKKYHALLTKEDKLKLLKISKELPEKLSIISHPIETTEPSSKQTWTFYQDVLIKDGAYTSFVVYKVAYNTKEFIKPKTSLSPQEEKEKAKLAELFQNPVSTQKDILNLLPKMKAFLNESKVLIAKKVVFENILRAHYFIFSNYPENIDSKKQKELITEYLNPFSKDFVFFVEGAFFDFINNLLKIKKGRDFLKSLQKNFSSWDKLPKVSRIFIPFLAQGLAGNKDYLTKNKDKVNSQELLKFADQTSFMLKLYIKTYFELKSKDETLMAYARFQLRFPKASPAKLPKLPKEWIKSLETYKGKELHLYTQELTKEIHPITEKIPLVTGVLINQKNKKKTIPEPKDKKQIYIFFAPWCAHCKELISTLAKTMPESFWNKTQLISSFSSDTSLLKSFLSETELQPHAKKAFNELLMLKETPETKEYYTKKISLYAVPKVILTNKKGEILDFSFELEPHPEKDLARDLDLILSQY